MVFRIYVYLHFFLIVVFTPYLRLYHLYDGGQHYVPRTVPGEKPRPGFAGLWQKFPLTTGEEVRMSYMDSHSVS